MMNAPQLIDSHCHLNYDYLPKSSTDLVREARENGVEALVTVGTDLSSIALVQKISEEFEDVFHTIGVHPHEASTLSDSDMETLETAARHPKCRAIGEIGLDYHYDHSPRNLQIQRLEQQLELALKLNQPVVIHSREGEDDLLTSLRHYASKVPSGSIPGVIHCFTGTLPFGKACLDLGFLVSFSGIITFKKAEDVRAAVAAFPLNRMLVETDSPYLAPIPYRGKKCEPSMVKLTAQKVAEIKGVSFEEVAQVTTANAKGLFRIL
jgi:TatD DNase family protein